MDVYLSQSNNSYFNLAFENWLFLEKLQDKKILFLWQNSPCVVIGRAQNPWLECDLEAIKSDNILMLRRQSGGGAVYHDLGNLNYTIISPKKGHDVKANLELVCSVIKKIGISVDANQRNDIIVNYRGSSYKVSGSAFREKKDRAFHHGTLLVNTNIERLYNYLHQPIDKSLATTAVKSYRSKVINLSEIKTDLQTQELTKAFLSSFKNFSLRLISEENSSANQDFIRREIKRMKSWQWRFGMTLPFTKSYTKDNQNIKVKISSGIISKVYSTTSTMKILERNIKYKHQYDFNFFEKLLRKKS